MTDTIPAFNGTIVRSIQGSLRALAWVQAPLAARAASWLFFRTPSRLQIRPSQQEVLDLGTFSEFLHTSGPIGLWHWGDAGPIVLLVHGWGGRSAQLSAFVEPLVRSGHRVVALDFHGHGSSSGTRTSIPEMASVLIDIGRDLGPIHAIVAHSLGNNGAMLALQRGLSVNRYVGIAGPLHPERWFQAWVGGVVEGKTYEVERARVERDLGTTLKQLNAADLARERGEPMLWIHDRNDRDVSFAGAQPICDAWSGARLYATEGLGHRRILADGQVVKEVVTFLQAPSNPVLSTT